MSLALAPLDVSVELEANLPCRKFDPDLWFSDSPAQLELALSSYEPADKALLEAKGWRVTGGLDVSSEADTYRAYIQASRGEFTVAKEQNVFFRSGSAKASNWLSRKRTPVGPPSLPPDASIRASAWPP